MMNYTWKNVTPSIMVFQKSETKDRCEAKGFKDANKNVKEKQEEITDDTTNEDVLEIKSQELEAVKYRLT